MPSLVGIVGLALLGSIATSWASPVQSPKWTDRPSDSVANCVAYQIPLTVTSENLVLNITKFKDNFDLITFLQELSAKNAAATFDPIAKTMVNVTEDVAIAATFCSPKNPSNKDREAIVLVTSSGLAYDSRYWDSTFEPSKYSFVEAAVGQGYSVLNYDRLGVGQSEK